MHQDSLRVPALSSLTTSLSPMTRITRTFYGVEKLCEKFVILVLDA